MQPFGEPPFLLRNFVYRPVPKVSPPGLSEHCQTHGHIVAPNTAGVTKQKDKESGSGKVRVNKNGRRSRAWAGRVTGTH